MRYPPARLHRRRSTATTLHTSALLHRRSPTRSSTDSARKSLRRRRLDDGLLDFVIVEDRKFVGNIGRIPSLFVGRLDQQKGIVTHRVRELTIRSRESMLFHVDGEAVQGSDTLRRASASRRVAAAGVKRVRGSRREAANALTQQSAVVKLKSECSA